MVILRFIGWFSFAMYSVFLWPLALLILFFLANSDKQGKYSFAKPLRMIGTIYLVFFLIFLFNMIRLKETDISGYLMGVYMFLASGILFYWWGNQLIIRRQMYNEYRTLIWTHHVTSVEQIAKMVRKDKEIVKDELRGMINKKMLSYAYLDEQEERVILPQSHHRNLEKAAMNRTEPSGGYNQGSGANPASSVQPEKSAENSKPKQVFCPACGAGLRASSRTSSECEYCGTDLSAYM